MILNQQKTSDTFYFLTKVVIISFALIFTYQFTIGITLSKLDKISDVAIWFQDKVDNLDMFTTIKGVDKLIKKSELSDGEAKKLRNSTQKVLKNFSPIIDEIIMYEPKIIKIHE